MRYRKLTLDNDYTFGNGQLDFFRDTPEAVAQSVLTRLILWLGEWFLDVTEGTPYPESVLGKHSLVSADVTIQDRIFRGQGVVDIQNFSSTLNPETRGYSASFNLDTIYGPTQVQVANYANF